MKLFRLEFYKLIVYRKCFFVILLAIIIRAVLTFIMPELKDWRLTHSQRFFDEYLEYLHGDLTEDKAAYIIKEAEYIHCILEQHDASILTPGNAPDAEEFEYASSHSSSIAIFMETLERFNDVLAVGVNEQPAFIYQYGWLTLLSRLMSFDYLLVVTLLVLVLSVFCPEHRDDMATLLLTTQNGRRSLFFVKSFVFVVAVFIFALLYNGIEIIIALKRLKLPDGGEMLYSISLFSGIPADLTLKEATALVYSIKTIGPVLAGIICLSATVFFHNTMASFFSTATLLVLPYILKNLMGNIYFYLPFAAFDPMSLILSRHLNNVGSWIICISVVFTITAVIFIMAFLKYSVKRKRIYSITL